MVAVVVVVVVVVVVAEVVVAVVIEVETDMTSLYYQTRLKTLYAFFIFSPLLDKQSRKSGTKSKRVRTIFTPEQLERLEAEFERQQYMVGTERSVSALSFFFFFF